MMNIPTLYELAQQRDNAITALDLCNERIDELEAELAPWREMMAQLEALRGTNSLTVTIDDEGDTWFLRIVGYNSVTNEWLGGSGKGEDLPAAVNAAYGKVVGDE